MASSRLMVKSFIAALLAGGLLAAQEQSPKYPKVNVSTWYQVDPSWPKRPASARWADMPGLAVDSKDQVWIYTRALPPVQVYDSSGKFVKSWGESFIKKAHHLKIDKDGSIWLSDIGSHVIFQCTQDGKVLKTLGTLDAAGCDSAHMDMPTDMAITPAGEIFVSDGYGNNRVVHFNKDGKFVKEWGKLGSGPGEFSLPHAIAIDSRGRLYVADRNNARIQVFDQSGKLLSEWRNLIVPWGFWVTPADEIWVCGSSPMAWEESAVTFGCPPKDQVFMKFNPEGKVLQIWKVPKGEDGKEHPGDCNWVHSIAVDSKGNIYAGDIIGKRAQKFVKQKESALEKAP